MGLFCVNARARSGAEKYWQNTTNLQAALLAMTRTRASRRRARRSEKVRKLRRHMARGVVSQQFHGAILAQMSESAKNFL